MRSILRTGLGAIALVAIAGVALRISGASNRVEAQYKGPTGRAGRLAAWTMPILFDPLYRGLAGVLDLQPEDEVLDVACGSGVFLRKHAAHVRRIAGIDHSELQIDLARRENQDRVASGTAEFVTGDASALPWADDRFTVVTSNCVDCFDEKAGPALAEMHRVLRQGGRAVVADDYRSLMEAAGFRRVSMQRVGWGSVTTGHKE